MPTEEKERKSRVILDWADHEMRLGEVHGHPVVETITGRAAGGEPIWNRVEGADFKVDVYALFLYARSLEERIAKLEGHEI